jgi:hypothetical protein
MDVPLHYQISEYDCVPTTFINAIAYLFERWEVPPLVIRHIYSYSLDTVSRGAKLGRAGTSKYAIQLLAHWINAYKTRKFSVTTEYLEPEEIHVAEDSRILTCLRDGGVALCNVSLGRSEWHYLLGLRHDDEWVYFFDPYRRRSVLGLHGQARLLRPDDARAPNLAVQRAWLAREENRRLTFGTLEQRECVLMHRVR